MNSKQIIDIIASEGDAIVSRIISDLIDEHRKTSNKAKSLYNAYLGDVAIKDRIFKDVNKINSKLANDYRGDIIDGITGYLFGEPISYDLDKDAYSESEFNKISDALKSFRTRNDVEDLDSTTGEIMSICGYAARLLYIDKDGKERAMNIKPWEAIFVNDATVDEVQFGMIYYDVKVKEGGKSKTRTKVEWYDSENVTYYISTDQGDYVIDLGVGQNPQKHMFEYVPLIKFSNSNSEQGDFEKVNELIDAYDRLMSDIQNEVEEFRLAYLAFYGVEPTQETITAARQTGAFYFPEGTEGKFITKNLDAGTDFIENHKKSLNENIYKFSKAVDFGNEQFSGSAMSGESRKWKLVGLENRAKTKERKFTKGLRAQFKILASAWAKRNVIFNFEDLTFQFKRNLPVDLEYQAKATGLFKGNISDKTRLSLLPFIEDPEEELQQLDEEMGEMIDFGTDEPE